MPRKAKDVETKVVPENSSASEFWDSAAEQHDDTQGMSTDTPETSSDEQPPATPPVDEPSEHMSVDEKDQDAQPVEETDDGTKPWERSMFYALDFRKLDKDLSPDEQKEWNAIYASFRAGSILTGRVAGVDEIKVGGVIIPCLVVLNYRVKVLIPHSEVWKEEASERPAHVLRRFLGAEVDYIVMEVDREGDCVVASRKKALHHRRKAFKKRLPAVGDLVDSRVLAVGPTRLLLECGGYETTLAQHAISYGTILDLREDYKPGQTVKAVFKGLEESQVYLSIKEVNPHPFEGIENRHPLRTRRLSRIVGKYAGGVFCELEKGFTCMCLYSPGQRDCDFDLGDDVIIIVTVHDYENKHVYGKIVTYW